MNLAVVLARGLGTRMREADPTVKLADSQAAVANRGLKAMIPFGRPFLDYVLGAIANAGFERVCLVIGPEHNVIRDYYGALPMRRLQIEFAIQGEPRGTADAVAAAEQFAGTQPFLVLNSDNYYPSEALAALAAASGPAMAVFDPDAMLIGSNIPAERLNKFAVIEVDGEGCLKRIIEKPSEAALRAMPRPLGISMNCWRFGPAIFEACRSIGPSERGEFEITDAVQYAIDQMRERFSVYRCQSPVLDLSSRGDIDPVAAKLAGTEIDL